VVLSEDCGPLGIEIDAVLSVTAIICTRNRSRFLALAIGSLQNQTYAPHRYEILVVDNGSTDDTSAVVTRLARNSPVPVHLVEESQVGLSVARNTSWKFAQGEIVAYLDDDAIACPDWIEQCVKVYMDGDHVQGVGGRIEPWWESPPPTWMPSSMLRYLTSLDFGDQTRAIAWPEFLPGCNCSYRRNVFEHIGGFDTQLGRSGASLLAMEDNEFSLRAMRAGMTLYYSPHMAIRHYVSARRLTPSSVLAQSHWAGWSMAILEIKHFGFGHAAFHAAKEVLRSPSRALKAAYHMARGRRREAFWWTNNLSMGIGYVGALASARRFTRSNGYNHSS